MPRTSAYERKTPPDTEAAEIPTAPTIKPAPSQNGNAIPNTLISDFATLYETQQPQPFDITDVWAELEEAGKCFA